VYIGRQLGIFFYSINSQKWILDTDNFSIARPARNTLYHLYSGQSHLCLMQKFLGEGLCQKNTKGTKFEFFHAKFTYWLKLKLSLSFLLSSVGCCIDLAPY
jgi:hypothetical protein